MTASASKNSPIIKTNRVDSKLRPDIVNPSTNMKNLRSNNFGHSHRPKEKNREKCLSLPRIEIQRASNVSKSTRGEGDETRVEGGRNMP